MESGLEIAVCVVVLIAVACVGLFYCVHFTRTSGTFANTKTMLLANFVVVQPISGVVHLMHLGATRGYIDLLNYPIEYAATATLGVVVAIVGLVLGASGGRRATPGAAVVPHFTLVDKRLTLLLIVIMGAPALYGVLQVSEIAASMGSTRIIGLDGGTARFAFLSHWFTFIVTLGAALVLERFNSRNSGAVFLTVAVSVVLIAGALLWSGGRSIILLMAMPLVLYALPRMKPIQIPALAFGAVAAAIYAIVVSDIRSASLTAGAGVNLGNWLDWEWGRFSIIGTSFEYVRSNGFLYGETLIAGLANVFNPLLGLIGLGGIGGNLLVSTDIPSRVLYGDFSRFYIVPGLSAELYLNFGIPGIGVVYFLLGRASRWIDGRIRNNPNAISVLLLSFLSALVAFRSILSDSATLLFYIFYSGTPLLVAAGLSSLLRARRGASAGQATASTKARPARARMPPPIAR
ncbi:O-antigen polymerase [Devosia sp. CN2-171]|uniref:O-antigen polymerase n=1 Tax=Devosia sp. CN2-171 TaxID=3400909 RepID=UPI003BF82ECD